MSPPDPTPRPPVRRFNPLLPSRPILFPFAGDYAEMAVVYDVAAVLGLPERREALLAAQLASEAAITAARAAWAADVAAEPGANRPLTAAEQAQLAAWTVEEAALLQAAQLCIIGHTVIGLVWPFTDPPAPDPARPATFLLFPPPVLAWLTGDALHEVEAQMADPKEATPADS